MRSWTTLYIILLRSSLGAGIIALETDEMLMRNLAFYAATVPIMVCRYCTLVLFEGIGRAGPPRRQ